MNRRSLREVLEDTTPPVTEFTPEEEAELAEMERVLDDYNRARERGEKPHAPNYDLDKLMLLRDWQNERMAKEMEEFDRLFPNGWASVEEVEAKMRKK